MPAAESSSEPESFRIYRRLYVNPVCAFRIAASIALRRALLWALALLLAAAAKGQNTITTVAGGGPNNLPATSANLDLPTSVARDRLGNLYIAAQGASLVFKVDTSGTLTVVAGNASFGFYGDGGPATSATLAGPSGVAVDASGNLFIADTFSYHIRRVDAATGTITNVAGGGTDGVGDGGPATSARLYYPLGVTLDTSGNLFIADTNNQCIRRVDVATRIITTVAGNGTAGFNGDGGPATSANLSYPTGVAVDASGNLFIADRFNNRIRRVDAATGIIMTVAGNGTYGFSGDGGLATSASLLYPFGVAPDASGNLFIADAGNHRIRRVDAATGIITTVAGNGTAGFSGDSGPATSASLYFPSGVMADASGDLLIADTTNYRIRRVDGSTGAISTVAGNGTVGDGGAATSASLSGPSGVSLDTSGNLFIADAANITLLCRIECYSVKFHSAVTAKAGRSHQPGLDPSENLFPPRTRSFFWCGHSR